MTLRVESQPGKGAATVVADTFPSPAGVTREEDQRPALPTDHTLIRAALRMVWDAEPDLTVCRRSQRWP